jgi:hypothetical protein
MQDHNDQSEAEFDTPSRTGWGVASLRDLTPEVFANIGMPNIVYVKEVLAGELQGELGSEINLPADAKLYAVHAANGQRMAVVDSRTSAFAGAVQYDLQPLSVH